MISRRTLLATAGATTAQLALAGVAQAQTETQTEPESQTQADPVADDDDDVADTEQDYLDILDAQGDASWGSPQTKGIAVEGFKCVPSLYLNALGVTGDDWTRLYKKPEVAPKWAPLAETAEYAHVAAFESRLGDVFELNHDVMTRLARQNSFLLTPGKKTLFGLRGCTLDSGDASGPAATQKLRAILPDHVNFNCVMGVWDPVAKTVGVFKASTVPHMANMLKQVQCHIGCNLLSTGLYYYQVGLHGKGAKAANNRQVGAFLLQGTLFEAMGKMPSRVSRRVSVLRNFDDLTFTPKAPTEVWEFPNGPELADNLHSAIFDYDHLGRLRGKSAGEFGDKFSSAGCQVIKGTYQIQPRTKPRAFLPQPVGPWAMFRQAAGLSHPPQMVYPEAATSLVGLPINKMTTTDDQSAFQYMLLTGLEAQLASQTPEDFTDKVDIVRFGSSGDHVRNLQLQIRENQNADRYTGQMAFEDKHLAAVDGRFAYDSVWALLYHQHHRVGIMETGIMTMDRA